MNVYVFCLFLICVAISRAQDCRTSGQRCGAHEQCCGGCCYEGRCIDSKERTFFKRVQIQRGQVQMTYHQEVPDAYQSCLKSFNVCRDHVCIGEENCVEYRPPGCLRCEPLPICRL